jgi:1,4-dihydroxy-6-naphthoate synthase
MKLTLGFSPCPNDTFIFDAIVHQRIDTEGLEFELVIEDVEALNQKAFKHELNITKLSFHAFAHLLGEYALLDAGSALGKNVGPLLIARSSIPEKEISSKRIAIPGKYTTANFLLSLAFPKARNKKERLFSEIEDAVLNEEADAGLIIHENRFTYQDRGLVKLMDLGEYWESATQMPIPLGGIVVSRQLSQDVQAAVNRVVARSVAFALDHPDVPMPYVRKYAQEMDDHVMQQHIGLYVNEYTRELGNEGKAAVQRMFDIAMAKGVIPVQEKPIFVSSL